MFIDLLSEYAIWADPNLALSAVQQRLIKIPIANDNDLNLKLGTWNMEYMWQAKAQHFLETYHEIVSRQHLLAVQEVTEKGLQTIANASNYNFCVSQPNTRGQAVGFLVHPCLQIKQICEYPQLLNIGGVLDLRPALQIDLLDTQLQLNFSVVTLHLKSMCGRMSFTSYIRRKQLEQLVIGLKEKNSPILIMGDFNCLLDSATDINCLLADGYKLVNPHNHTSTQSKGGRLDGLFYNHLPEQWKLSDYNIHNFWRSSLAGRSLSDHGLLSWTLKLIK